MGGSTTRWISVVVALWSLNSFANNFLVKLSDTSYQTQEAITAKHGGTLEVVSEEGRLYRWTTKHQQMPSTWGDSNVEYIQKNFTIQLQPNPSILAARKLVDMHLSNLVPGPAYPDNPDFKSVPSQATSADPLLSNSWGMAKIDAASGWTKTKAGQGIIVAVTDTGIDYNHDDLIANMWRNSKEIPGDGVDNDNNGYVDDMVGWDFVAKDNKPYDLSMSVMDILLSGGNPGHGTHVAGVIGAALKNGLGTAGVAPKVSLMALRFIGENGQGDTEGAIQALDYAVKNGAKVINASWGSEAGQEDDKALKDAFERAEKAGVLIAVAAGNGRADQAAQAMVGFDNDTDPHPMIPASYPHANVVTVAALDSSDALAGFSNWGFKTCKLAAPGVKVFSTVPGNRYQDTIVDLGQMKVTWDGTSMATPHVAGALAALWSSDPNAKMETVKEQLLDLTKKVASVAGKVSTEGRLDLSGVTR